MHIGRKEIGDIVILSIDGQINIETVHDLKESFKNLLSENRKKIVFDFKKVGYIDSLGMATLIVFLRKLDEIGGSMVLCNLSPMVNSIFKISRIELAFQIFDEEGKALKSFGR
jgi:anti-sigma B factor antagonist